MAKVINVQEFREEGFVLIEDTQGKYLASKHTDKVVEIPDVIHPYIPRNPCVLLQSRNAMLT
jgi:hypothetical protein